MLSQHGVQAWPLECVTLISWWSRTVAAVHSEQMTCMRTCTPWLGQMHKGDWQEMLTVCLSGLGTRALQSREICISANSQSAEQQKSYDRQIGAKSEDMRPEMRA